jgi:hypothetical protein
VREQLWGGRHPLSEDLGALWGQEATHVLLICDTAQKQGSGPHTSGRELGVAAVCVLGVVTWWTGLS